MPEQRGGDEAPVYPIRLSEEFIEGLARVWLPRVLDHIQGIVSLLPTNPELGSPDVLESLSRHYGPNLRKLHVSRFVMVYRFDGAVVDALALEYGPRIVS